MCCLNENMPSPITENRNKDYQLPIDERQLFINNGYLHTGSANNRNNCNSVDNGIAMDDATGILLEEKNANGPSKPIIVNFGPGGTTTRTAVGGSTSAGRRTLSIVTLCKEAKSRNSLLLAASVLIVLGAVFGGLLIYSVSGSACSDGKYQFTVDCL